MSASSFECSPARARQVRRTVATALWMLASDWEQKILFVPSQRQAFE